MYFAVHIELDAHKTENEMIKLHDQLAQIDYHPAVGVSPRGFLDVRVTVPATGLIQAVTTTVATMQHLTEATAIAVEALTEKERDAREGFVHIPEMMSVTEAAEALGVKRQRILQMIDERKFPSAQQVGTTWVIAESDVSAKMTGRPQSLARTARAHHRSGCR